MCPRAVPRALTSPESKNVFARLAQHARFSEPAFRQQLARLLVTDKLRASQDLLRHFGRNHPGVKARLDAAADRVREQQRQLDGAENLDRRRGLDGAAAAAYFEGFGHMVRPPFVFERRSRRPTQDSVNALLDLVEPHRVPVMDRMTLALVNRRVFSPDDFEDRGGSQGVRLRPAAFKKYLGHYEATLGGAFDPSGSPRNSSRSGGRSTASAP